VQFGKNVTVVGPVWFIHASRQSVLDHSPMMPATHRVRELRSRPASLKDMIIYEDRPQCAKGKSSRRE